MEPYRYCESLRISHPAISPKEITKALELNPFSQWNIGDTKATYKGRTLVGARKENYWTHHPHGDEKISSDKICLEDYLEKLTIELNGHEEFLKEIAKSGGSINYYIGIFSEHNIGYSFSAILLKNISNLNVDLQMDIYAYPEPGT